MKQMSDEFLRKVEEQKPSVYEYLKDGYSSEEMFEKVYMPKVNNLISQYPEEPRNKLGNLGLNEIRNEFITALTYVYPDESAEEKRDKDLTFPTSIWSRQGKYWAAPQMLFSGLYMDQKEEIEKLIRRLEEQNLPDETQVRFKVSGELSKKVELVAALWGTSPSALLKQNLDEVVESALEKYKEAHDQIEYYQQVADLKKENAELKERLEKFDQLLAMLKK